MGTSLVPLQSGAAVQAPLASAPDDAWNRQAEGVLGPLFPMLHPDLAAVESDGTWWRAWAEDLWESVNSLAARPIWIALRNREMRKGNQWIDSRGMGAWYVPPKHPQEVRAVWNMIGPALDLHDEVCAEQRPGFRVTPRVLSQDAMKHAEAQQQAGEYQYDEQTIPKHLKQWRYYAGTDGVVFPMVYWDPARGPRHDFQDGSKEALGDPYPCAYTIEQVRVSPNASATEDPYWWVLRESIPLAQAVAEHGDAVAEAYPSGGIGRYGAAKAYFAETRQTHRTGQGVGLSAFDGETIDRYWVFVPPLDGVLPGGLAVCCVGDVLVYGPTELPFGKVPVFRMTDGSTDPGWYVEPRMNTWVEPQMQVNVGVSKWIEALRKQANGQIAVKAGLLNVNTMMAGLMRVLEIDTAGPIGEAMQVLPGVSIGGDLVNFIAMAKKEFEDRSGWNDVARGQFAAGTSGRAILAVREQLERTFAPGVNAVADGATKWLELTLGWMGWGYDIPRTVALTGSHRVDLALELHSAHFQPMGLVKVDPESMMPLPRALRLYILDDALARGIISKEEWRRRYPYATLSNLDTPDTDHHARAKRVVSAIKRAANGEQVVIPEILWMDDEAIHQDVLQRELCLNDDANPYARQMAFQRWMQLAQQAMTKMAPAPMAAPSGGHGARPKLSPQSQPLGATSPGLPVAPSPRAQ